jgi:Molecular chaperone, HSP90 family
MDISKKDQKQTAGDNAVQTQIETQNNYNVTNHIYNIIQPTEDVIANATEEDWGEELTIEGCNTSLWKRTLGKKDKKSVLLKESYLKARENAMILLAKVKQEFPKLIVPDITQLDSLWTVADTIIGEDYFINPLEGYVLGIAFLFHDAALSYDAVEGKTKLRVNAVWKDAELDFHNNTEVKDFMDVCDAATIHILHEMNSKKILFSNLEDNKGFSFGIYGSDVYLDFYKDLIFKISACQFWSISDIERVFRNQDNPMGGIPNEWIINKLKLACIFRCVLAGSIDNGRVPANIYGLLKENDVSHYYWKNHICLSQICEYSQDKMKLCVTSKPFKKKDFAAWNVAYEAVKLFDEELKKSNELLKSEGLSFSHMGVIGAESKEALSKYIKPDGWQPCSFGVHTSNVKALIENLGGSKLYGEENMLFVALRELIQNARDAIHARRKLDNGFDDGRIIIRLKEDDRKRWIEVEDNGIGMSLNCIKYNLLDFGSSYWKSNLAKYENPGLRSKRFKSIGKFGIGFYSVFMVAKSVVVVTRRYEGSENANIVEFPEGLTLSPILSTDKLSTRISTIVRFELKDDVNIKFNIKRNNAISLQKALPLIVAGLDTDVFF